MLKITEQDFGKINASGTNLDEDKLKFSSLINNFTTPEVQNTGISIDLYRNKVEIPATYYLQRGYSIEVLDKYDVGTCKRHKRPLYQLSLIHI